jgi:hypothetical protein
VAVVRAHPADYETERPRPADCLLVIEVAVSTLTRDLQADVVHDEVLVHVEPASGRLAAPGPCGEVTRWRLVVFLVSTWPSTTFCADRAGGVKDQPGVHSSPPSASEHLVLVAADAEVIGGLPARFTIRPGALSVIVSGPGWVRICDCTPVAPRRLSPLA